MAEFPPERTGRRGRRRRVFYPSECLVLDVTKLKSFLKENRASSIVEFAGIGRSIDISREAHDLLLLDRLPPPLVQQEIGIEAAPWGPDRNLVRYLFRCPWCARRVAKLFIPFGESGLGCRDCNDVRYPPNNGVLDVLVVEHARVGREIQRLVSERARGKTHLTVPGTDAEIDQRLNALLDTTRAMEKKLRDHAGPLGMG